MIQYLYVERCKPLERVYVHMNHVYYAQLCGSLTHFCPPLRFRNQVPTFAVRETDVSRHYGGTSGAPLKPLRDDSALRALSSLGGLRGVPEVSP